MKSLCKRLGEKHIVWPATLSDKDVFAEVVLPRTGRRCDKNDRSAFNAENGLTPVFWETHYEAEDSEYGHPKMLSNHLSGLWVGSRKGAENHPLFKANGVNCRISCLPDKMH